MKKILFTGILAVAMCAVLTVLGLFDFEYSRLIISLVGLVLFAAASVVLKKNTPEKTSREFFRLRPVRFRDIGAMIACFIVLIFGTFMLNTLASGFYDAVGIELSETRSVVSGDNYSILMITAVLLPAVYEEFFFRGAVSSYISNKNEAVRIVWTALLFTVMHGVDPYFITTFFAGIVFGISVKLTGSIFAAVVLHFINNIFSYSISYYSDIFSEIELTWLMVYLAGFVLLIGIYLILTVAIGKRKKRLKRTAGKNGVGGKFWQETITEDQEEELPQEERKTARNR